MKLKKIYPDFKKQTKNQQPPQRSIKRPRKTWEIFVERQTKQCIVSICDDNCLPVLLVRERQSGGQRMTLSLHYKLYLMSESTPIVSVCIYNIPCCYLHCDKWLNRSTSPKSRSPIFMKFIPFLSTYFLSHINPICYIHFCICISSFDVWRGVEGRKTCSTAWRSGSRIYK